MDLAVVGSIPTALEIMPPSSKCIGPSPTEREIRVEVLAEVPKLLYVRVAQVEELGSPKAGKRRFESCRGRLKLSPHGGMHTRWS